LGATRLPHPLEEILSRVLPKAPKQPETAPLLLDHSTTLTFESYWKSLGKKLELCLKSAAPSGSLMVGTSCTGMKPIILICENP
jgi:hypothetical protein